MKAARGHHSRALKLFLITVMLVSLATGCGGGALANTSKDNHLIACHLLTARDARRLLGHGDVFPSVQLPGVNACTYSSSPAWVKGHASTSAAVAISLLVNSAVAPVGRRPVRVDGRPALWTFEADDVGVLSMVLGKTRLSLTVDSQRLPETRSEYIAARAAVAILSKFR